MKNILYTLLVLNLISCQSEKATTTISKANVFEKPIKNVDVPLQVQTVDSEKGDTLYLANNTQIIIPKNAFVDSLGSPIKGEVEIYFQEYHTEAEVILSGIPMQYDSAGTEYTFETDGMFKISGKQKGSRIEIAPDKSLKVKTQSYKEDTPCFNYYTQNKEGEWSYKLTKNRELNTEKVIQQEIAKIKVLDENAVGLDLKINYKKYPDLKKFKNISWMYNGNKPDTLKIELLANVEWNEFELEKTDESLYSYLLVGKNKSHNFVLPITPAFSEDELEEVEALIREGVKAEELAYSKLKTSYEREAVVFSFGIHNWDRRVLGTSSMELVVSLEYEQDIKYFYVINKNNQYQYVRKYHPKNKDKVRFLTSGNVVIIAFLKEENQIAYYVGALEKEFNKGISIPLVKNDKTIKSPNDLQEIIDLI